jgi:polyisoprenoid-binding protein YceI
MLRFVSMFLMATTSMSAVAATTYQIQPSSSPVEFLATGRPGFLKIKGTGAYAEGTVTQGEKGFAGAITVNLAKIDTGIDLRNAHMHEKYLESQKFPTAVLQLQSVAFESGNAGKCTFSGELEIKATKKPVSGTCELTMNGDQSVKVKSEFSIALAEYPVGVPSHLGITVAEKVGVTVELTATPVNVAGQTAQKP